MQRFCLSLRIGVPVLLMAFVALTGMSSTLRADEKSPTDTVNAMLLRGQAIYAESCADCHGDRAQGAEGGHKRPLAGDLSVIELADVIATTMPEGEAELCVGKDAIAVAAWLHQKYYSEEARIRNDPPRVKLTRLTGTQLRQSLADLYGHFSGNTWPESKRGITGNYFDGARPRKEGLKIDRLDAAIDFDWKHDGPGKDINPKDFYVRWRGGVKVDETGRYDIVIRSTCAFICTLGRSDREFINNRVQSGDKTEFRRSIVLNAGRVYPIQIDLYQRKRKTEQPPASISLSWVPPRGSEQVIPERSLLPTGARAEFALQASLPPDDRSYGFELGLSVDRQWDASTTASAVEFAQIAVDELWPGFLRKRGKGPDGERARLREFLNEFVSVAFRGPVDDASRQFYVGEQIASTEDNDEAITRCVLVTLKSPRFLYPGLDLQGSDSQRVANRLALTLFDSLPSDEWLLKQVRENRLKDDGPIRQAARRMVDDFRARGKTRQFLYEWLNLTHLGDIAKTSESYPDFTSELVADSKASLDAFLDDIVQSESSDFRQLFLADWSYTTPRLEQYYGDAWKPADDKSASGLTPTVAAAGRSGILSHPYLMSGLAYQDMTSPIHRGVFLRRYILGRAIQPPANASFKPLTAELHPDLTTRQRVELQTSPVGCRECHTKINGLGYALENFGADGRFRDRDADKPIDTAGAYITRGGETVDFQGANELAAFIADSHDAHRSFVKRAFQHFVKQPVAAYGADRLDTLTDQFRKSGFHIRKLLVEIAVVATSQPVNDAGVESVSSR